MPITFFFKWFLYSFVFPSHRSFFPLPPPQHLSLSSPLFPSDHTCIHFSLSLSLSLSSPSLCAVQFFFATLTSPFSFFPSFVDALPVLIFSLSCSFFFFFSSSLSLSLCSYTFFSLDVKETCAEVAKKGERGSGERREERKREEVKWGKKIWGICKLRGINW